MSAGSYRLELGGQSLSVNAIEGGGTVGVVISGPPTGGAILQRQCTAVHAHVDNKMKTNELRSRERRMKRLGRKESSCRPRRRWRLLPPPAAASSVRSRSSIN